MLLYHHRMLWVPIHLRRDLHLGVLNRVLMQPWHLLIVLLQVLMVLIVLLLHVRMNVTLGVRVRIILHGEPVVYEWIKSLEPTFS